MQKRHEAVTFKGQPLTLIGPELTPGSDPPHFTLVDNELNDLKCEMLHGKVRVISVVPSLDTPVCATQTRKFNEAATDLSDEVTILTVSRDLPFAQARFCGAEGLDRVVTASDYKYREFGPAWGCLIEELELLTRAVFVVDDSDRIVHAQYVAEVTDEPNYDAALEAVKQAL